MNQVHIYVEGEGDARFLRQYIEYHFTAAASAVVEIEPLNGKDGLLAKPDDLAPTFALTADQGRTNLVIFDADEAPAQRAADLRAAAVVVGGFEFFIFPDNAAAGDLESLLLGCVTPDNEPILTCYDAFRECIERHPTVRLQPPLRKSKVDAYLDVLLPSRKKGGIKEEKRDYLNPDHWDLDAPALSPLRVFLTRYLLGQS